MYLAAGEAVPEPPASPGQDPAAAATPAEDAALDQELARLEAADAERSSAAVAAAAATSSRPPPLPPQEAGHSGGSGGTELPTPPMSQAAPAEAPQQALPAFFQAGARTPSDATSRSHACRCIDDVICRPPA